MVFQPLMAQVGVQEVTDFIKSDHSTYGGARNKESLDERHVGFADSAFVDIPEAILGELNRVDIQLHEALDRSNVRKFL